MPVGAHRWALKYCVPGGTVEPVNIGTTQEQQPHWESLQRLDWATKYLCLVEAFWENNTALRLCSTDILANIRAFTCITTGPGRQKERAPPLPKAQLSSKVDAARLTVPRCGLAEAVHAAGCPFARAPVSPQEKAPRPDEELGSSRLTSRIARAADGRRQGFRRRRQYPEQPLAS